MANNRGLSNIVATVLIVLLALAAVAIIWTFISGMIDDGSRSASLQNKCFATEIKPVSCQLTGLEDANNDGEIDAAITDATIVVQNMRGEATGYSVVLTDGSGLTYVSDEVTSVPGVLGTDNTAAFDTLPAANAKAPIRAAVAVKVTSDDGAESAACPTSTVVVPCSAAA